MLRLVVTIALLFVLAAGFAWLAERPGEIVISWLGVEIRTSLIVAAVALAAAVGLGVLLWLLLRAILHSPQAARSYFRGRRRDRGYRALTEGMIALGAGDEARATRNSAEARRLLGSEPLPLLLTAQAAQLEGNRAGAREAFEAMLARSDTRILGLHGLFVEAQRQGDQAAARAFAEEAVKARPALAWAGTALFEYQSAAREWDAALETLAANTQAGLIERSRAQRLQAVLQVARGMDLEDADPDNARTAALEAHRLAPDLVPAAVLAARLASRLGDVRRATKVLETTWRLFPHPELADAYAAVRPGDSTRDRLNRIRHLAELRPNNAEASLAVARAAINAQDWGEARAALDWLVRENPTERACLLMAEIEDGEHDDEGRVRDWLARAVRARRDPTWMADGHVFETWAPISPISGRLDAFEWKVPAERLGPPVGIVIDARPLEALALAPAAMALPAAPIEELSGAAQPGPVQQPISLDAQVLTGSETVAEAVRSVSTPESISSTEPPSASPPRGNGAAAAQDEAVHVDNGSSPGNGVEPRAFPPAVDDPGPVEEDAGAAETPPRRRFWLF
jgi:HemY protein